jgi:hypothetical protein
VNALVVVDPFGKTQQNAEVVKYLIDMQRLLMRSVVGLDFPGYRRYLRITNATGRPLVFMDGSYQTILKGHRPDAQEAEFVLQFATNAVLQIESLVGDMDKPFEI